MVALAFVALLVASFLAVAGLREVLVATGRTQRLQALVVVDDSLDARPSALAVWNRRFVSTRPGRWVQRQLVLAGVERPPLLVAALVVGAGVASGWALFVLLAPAFAVLGAVVGIQGLRVFLARARDRRLEAFINQMPELARVLANAASAGLSIRTAIGMATEELADPASTELRIVADQMRVGADLETAMLQINERLPSREIRVLISTLLVSSRSGGSLVTSLRDIADTLEMRKEVRREVRTVLAQAVLTGYLVVGLGLMLTAGLNLYHAGTVQLMTTEPLGQAALITAGTLYAVGMLLIHRITRIEP
jgi:tight adherence protein B